MRLDEVYDALNAALKAAGFSRVYLYWPDSVTPPVAVLGAPLSGSYHRTFQNGLSDVETSVWVLVGRADVRSAMAKVNDVILGDKSVRDALEGYETDAWGALNVSAWEVETVEIGNIQYLAAKFTVTVYG